MQGACLFPALVQDGTENVYFSLLTASDFRNHEQGMFFLLCVALEVLWPCGHFHDLEEKGPPAPSLKSGQGASSDAHVKSDHELEVLTFHPLHGPK